MTRPAIASDEPEVFNPRVLEGRASLSLKILTGLNVLALALGLLSAIPEASLFTAAWMYATVGASVLYVLEARALDRRRPWAVAALRPLLAVAAAFGLAIMVATIGEGRLRLPFETVLAAWAWLGPADVRPTPEPDRRSVALVAGLAGLLVVVLVAKPVFGWGGFLDVREGDLRATLEVDCGAPGAGPPQNLAVTYGWSWASRSPFPSGLDVVVIGWKGTDAQGRVLYLLGDTPPSGAGVHPGLQEEPSIDLALQAEHETPGSWHWGVQLADQQLGEGRIVMQLERVRQGPGPFTLSATYVHVGLWRHDTAPVACSW